jgi:hypothetical protein
LRCRMQSVYVSLFWWTSLRLTWDQGSSRKQQWSKGDTKGTWKKDERWEDRAGRTKDRANQE